MKTVGFIGLGTMGQPMAMNLLNSGYPVVVYNRTPEKAEELVEAGAEFAASPAIVARSVDVVITMVSNDTALKEVYYAENGLLAGLHPGLDAIDCSTVSPGLSRQLHDELKEHFVGFLDAPVTGSKPAAIEGSLLFMVGGSSELIAEHQDLFNVMGRKTLHMGPNGCGSQAKLAHNLIVGINMAGLCEGIAFATKSGINPEQFVELVRLGNATSKMAELKGDKILDGNYDVQFSLELMLKDLKLASEITHQLNIPAPVLRAALSVYQVGDNAGDGPADLSALMRSYEGWIGSKVVRQSRDLAVRNQLDAVHTSTSASTTSGSERRRSLRVPMNIDLQLSVYQWEQEGSFSGQNIQGRLYDLSEDGLQIASSFPLAMDMFIIIQFPQESGLPPMIGKIIRIEPKTNEFRYGCMLSGLPPVTRVRLEEYLKKVSGQDVEGLLAAHSE